ncbi:putative Response regulator with antiterminator output domain [Nostocoides japonicum T1-X7]|uniref:Putative Response regulator with antiterminator output domain n=1 Tax=Nostocoides japonicum T1-X7 TaxID=1194083 RepID=A0A077M3V9_9MICO|nr:GAF and ANTAR domain-containing protein [Tetrasphaera japonica]CCH79717.1 putative Response regulator with antiterminator output domain [Tetrasphaera japonica T1-X7]
MPDPSDLVSEVPAAASLDATLDAALAQDFAEVARTLQAQPDLARTLSTVCELAVAVLGAQEAAITTVDRGRFATVASTGELPRHVDRIQYETHEGPCLESLLEGGLYSSGDLRLERRWPRFAARASEETGVRSMLSHRLSVEEGTIGALNVYSRETDAFTAADIEYARVFATHAAVALRASQVEEKAGQLENALRSNRRIGTAVGILMATRGLSEDDGFQVLRKASMDTNRKLADVADDVIYTGSVDRP